MAIRIQVRKGAAAAWTTANPILALGEPGLETDTNLLKFGDGVSDWNTLQYFGPATTEYTEGDVDASISGPAILWEDVGDVLTPISAAKPLPVNVISGSITIGTVEITNDAGNPIPVNATDLDIRNLVFATDKVDVSGSTLAANSGVDIGDVTINNTVGAPANVQIGDGTLIATVRNTGAADSLNVAITDASGNQITTFGGASEYTEGATDASITGTAILMEGGADTLLPVQGTVADGLLVNLGANNDVTVTGTVDLGATDNAVLDAIAASVAAIDTDTSTIITSVQLLDDAVYTDGSGTVTKGIAILGQDGTNPQAIKTDANGELQIDVLSITAGDNLIGRFKLSDGTDVADILDLTNSNPLTVAIVDSNGDQITSFGGGTQYTEDAAAAANPVGTAPMLVRSDSPGALVTTDGDNVAQRGTNYGAAYTQIVSSAGAFIDTFGGGTQYTEGDTDATIVGTALMMEGAANTLVAAPGTAADGLLVNLGTNNDITLAALPAVDATKTVGTSVMALQTVSASSVAISSAVATGNAMGATIFVHFGRESVTAAGAGVNIRIEASSKSSGNGHWYPVAIFTTGFATCETEALTATEPAGETVLAVASTTNLTAGDIIFIFNTTIGSSEWHRIKSIVAATSVTIEDGLVFEQTAAASDIFDSAEMFVAQLDLTSISRIRVVADGSLFTQAFAIEVDMITFDSVG